MLSAYKYLGNSGSQLFLLEYKIGKTLFAEPANIITNDCVSINPYLFCGLDFILSQYDFRIFFFSIREFFICRMKYPFRI